MDEKNLFLVILNEVKDLNPLKYEILRFAQNDNQGEIKYPFSDFRGRWN